MCASGDTRRVPRPADVSLPKARAVAAAAPLESAVSRRLQQMRKQQEKRQQWLERGHGEYQHLLDEKQFFAAMKGEERMVCHFFRDNWPCKVIDRHMAVLCRKHIECKFAKACCTLLAEALSHRSVVCVPLARALPFPNDAPPITGAQIDAEKSQFLTEKLKIWMLPTIAVIRNEKTVDYVVGLDDMGGKDDFATEVLEARLAAAGVLTLQQDAARPAPARNVRKGAYVTATDADEDSDFD